MIEELSGTWWHAVVRSGALCTNSGLGIVDAATKPYHHAVVRGEDLERLILRINDACEYEHDSKWRKHPMVVLSDSPSFRSRDFIHLDFVYKTSMKAAGMWLTLERVVVCPLDEKHEKAEQ